MREEEKQLKEEFSINEREAFRKLFLLYYKPMCLAARLYTAESDEAEDIVQQVFIKFWEEKRFRNINTSFRHYLHTSVRNSCFNYLEKEKTRLKRLSNIEEQTFVEQAIEFMLHKEEKEVFERAYDALPPQSRKVFELVYFADQPYKDAAQSLNLSVNTVKSHLKNAIRILKNSPVIHNYFGENKKK